LLLSGFEALLVGVFRGFLVFTEEKSAGRTGSRADGRTPQGVARNGADHGPRGSVVVKKKRTQNQATFK
jgi:hypothetical protein